MRRRLAAATAAAAILALALPAAAASAACPKTTLGDIEDEVMCPVCGTPLGLATEAPQAQRERAYIEELIADCRSKQEIKTALVAQFGDGVLALPGDEGGEDELADVLVYAIPALALLAAAGGLAFALVHWRRRREATPGSDAQAPGAASNSRLDADLGRYDL